MMLMCILPLLFGVTPDLLVHRGIKHVLAKKSKAEETPEETAVILKSWEETGLQCSSTERRSDEASRFAISALKMRIHEQ
jgi:exoribonuclease R